MVTKDAIELFLKEFKIKMSIWGILISGRKKNKDSISLLEIYPPEIIQVVKDLNVEDYSEGPLEELLNMGSPMWVFGKTMKGKEIYIKLTMGESNNQVLCISFHIAEHSMKYPFKQ
ncbi:toxin [Siphonobacter sp. BAB-5405]|uniref:type II toxin-antitoxin system MqsR family toxin n=1 Tax=Siphonobacter sp. BAB-5405 TaxID=1864825 RepID=UPI000C7FF097|nr:type II toxin-antitoxin system MqsR family toxin [Siphonobacter sp. BAB-5405]PMD83730.1 toxin [Siphonobacter sp. BAB-5405]